MFEYTEIVLFLLEAVNSLSICISTHEFINFETKKSPITADNQSSLFAVTGNCSTSQRYLCYLPLSVCISACFGSRTCADPIYLSPYGDMKRIIGRARCSQRQICRRYLHTLQPSPSLFPLLSSPGKLFQLVIACR